MRRLTPLVVAVFLLALGPGTAARAEGPYMAVRAGLNLLSDANIDDVGDFVEDVEAIDPGADDFDPGPLVGAALGYAGPGVPLRIEGELTYRRNGLDEVSGLAFEDGHLSSLTFMGNLFYDLELLPLVTPYFGGGAGFSRVALNDPAVAGIQGRDDEDVVFAYQAAAGVALALLPQTALTAEYRYFHANDPQLNATTLDYQGHSVLAGLQFSF